MYFLVLFQLSAAGLTLHSFCYLFGTIQLLKNIYWKVTHREMSRILVLYVFF